MRSTVYSILAVVAVACLLTACAPQDTATDVPDEAEDGSTEVDEDAETIARAGLMTDTSQSSVDLSLLLGGGPAKDGIPALTDPLMETVEEADADQLDENRGIFVDFDGDRRFYPFSILVWHEVVNDTVGGRPVAITF